MEPIPPRRPASASTAPWLAPDLLPEASLGGQPGVWLGEPGPMSLEDISARLKAQERDDKAPIHWVEVPGAPRVVHVSEVPELWDSQIARDLRHLKSTINRNAP